ncbi:MAG: ATP-binding protein [Oligoflexus sp.]|nr:ATP-binding protein [Oligoflexus sp.]
MAFDCKAADFVFEIVNRRYEKGSIIITTNLAFKEWGQIFPGAPCVTAMIDRLTHHARIIKVDGDSYRLRESRRGKEKANA